MSSLAPWKAAHGWETESLTYSDSDTDSIYDPEPLVYPESEIESIVDPHEAVESIDAFTFCESNVELTSLHTKEIASVFIDTEIVPALETSCRDVPAGRKAPPCKRKITNNGIAMRTRAGSIRATRSNVHAGKARLFIGINKS